MRKPVLPRFLLLLALYLVLFGVIVQFQFARRDDFTLRSGDIVVRGHYRESSRFQLPNTYAVSGGVNVFFGGMEFLVGGAESMTLTDNGAYFQLESGPEISFITQYSGGAIELLIEMVNNAPEESGAVSLPYRPLPTSRIRAAGASFVLSADSGGYRFSAPVAASGVLELTPDSAVSYRAVQDRQTASPRDFLLTQALSAESFQEAFAQWLDKSYLGWNRAVSTAGGADDISGELASAYLCEALKRGTYKPAAAAVMAAYSSDSYEASPYIGRLASALRSFSAAERERSTRLSRIFNDRAMDFLKELRVIRFLAVRGYGNLMDDAAELLRGFDPAAMMVEQSAGILEGRADWEEFRAGGNNPFDRLIDQAFFVITDNLRKNPQSGVTLVFAGNEADTELNLRLGYALSRYEDETTAALGRTLILSALSFADISGAIPQRISRDAGGGFSPLTSAAVSSARIYRLCAAGPNYAQSRTLIPGASWSWTAATEVSVTQDGAGNQDIAVSFPAGETHYMLIRGIRPFARLQLHGVNYFSDSQFERYDSSGWAYSASEQTLLIKLRHRAQMEHITIIY
ncbi:MAG: hypothetical protein LBB82_00535 [Treponema sp.]|nr:hypothetical protein [Treponema sp.]